MNSKPVSVGWRTILSLDKRMMRHLRRGLHLEQREQICLGSIPIVRILNTADVRALSFERAFNPL